jgi:hypothetical protein
MAAMEAVTATAAEMSMATMTKAGIIKLRDCDNNGVK